MTDIPRGQGGDGSPQLDGESGTQVPEFRELCDHICRLPADHVEHGMVHQYGYELPSPRALVRRLQQELVNDGETFCKMSAELDAARGRVEELTEALRDGIEAMRLTREYVGEELLPAVFGWSWFDWTENARALLAKVVPEKETP